MRMHLNLFKVLAFGLSSLATMVGCSLTHQLDRVGDSSDQMNQNTSEMKDDLKNFTKSTKESTNTTNANMKEVATNVQTLSTTLTTIDQNSQRALSQGANKQAALVSDMKKMVKDATNPPNPASNINDVVAKVTDAQTKALTQVQSSTKEVLDQAADAQQKSVEAVKNALTEVTTAEADAAKSRILMTIQLARDQDIANLKSATNHVDTFAAARSFMCHFEFRLWSQGMPEDARRLAIDQGVFSLLKLMNEELEDQKDVRIYLEANDPQAKFNALVSLLKTQDCSELKAIVGAGYKSNALNFYALLLELLQKEQSGKLSDIEQGVLEYKTIAVLALQTYHNFLEAKAMKTAATVSGVLKDGEALSWWQVTKLALGFNSWKYDFSAATDKQLQSMDVTLKLALATELEIEKLNIIPAFDGKLIKILTGAEPSHPENASEAQFKINCDLVAKH